MLEGEGEEVVFSQPQHRYMDLGNGMETDQLEGGQDSFDLVDEFGATQSSEAQSKVSPLIFSVAERKPKHRYARLGLSSSIRGLTNHSERSRLRETGLAGAFLYPVSLTRLS